MVGTHKGGREDRECGNGRGLPRLLGSSLERCGGTLWCLLWLCSAVLLHRSVVQSSVVRSSVVQSSVQVEECEDVE